VGKAVDQKRHVPIDRNCRSERFDKLNDAAVGQKPAEQSGQDCSAGAGEHKYRDWFYERGGTPLG